MELNLGGKTERISFQLQFQRGLRQIKERFQPKPKTPEEMMREELFDALENARYELEAAYINFDCADSADLATVCAYQLKAAQENYNYLTKLAKQHGVYTCNTAALNL